MKHPLQARDCFRKVIQFDKKVREDTYLLPYATVELALLARDQGNIQEAVSFLEDAR